MYIASRGGMALQLHPSASHHTGRPPHQVDRPATCRGYFYPLRLWLGCQQLAEGYLPVGANTISSLHLVLCRGISISDIGLGELKPLP
jgi:hypothetical protein